MNGVQLEPLRGGIFYEWLEPIRGGTLLFNTKFPKITGTHFISLERMKG